ncbi:Uncharacterised protein [Mycoplasmopsis bovigenitalium]|uniref:ICEF-II n=1 Tax=Mycoplasmopsis bovigenitalium TaxID=2112 RepID=A0A449A8H9_9BACT|nr:hypothetical protein [Mycoplasmopsis bovigenitalium]VEU60593.1 Uncharacterised protein [Mycoplasmopsis bovigenitalium]
MKKKYFKLLAILPTVCFSPLVVAAKVQQLPPEWRENFKFDKTYVEEFNARDLQNNPSDKFRETSNFRTYKKAVGSRANYRLDMPHINVYKHLSFTPKNEKLIKKDTGEYGQLVGAEYEYNGYELRGSFSEKEAEAILGTQRWQRIKNAQEFLEIKNVEITFTKNTDATFKTTERYEGYGEYDFDENLSREAFYTWYRVDTVRFNINGTTRNKNELQKYNSWWNEALRAVKNEILIESDTGGNLTTPIKSGTTQVSNKSKLEAEIRKINESIQRTNPHNKLRINYRINSDDDSKNSIDIVVRDTSTNGFQGSKLLKSDIKIKYTPSASAQKAEINERLIINLGKYLDYENYSTKLVDDKLVQVEKDKKIGLQSDKKHWYGGKWIAHSPLSISFNTTKKENEVLFVNGKKVDVLDQLFFKKLADNRKDANDTERVLNFGISTDTTKTDENSHGKNEYRIKIVQYKPGEEHIEKNIDLIYEKIIIIDSKSLKMDFKWYAWDPENNEHQKLLIEKYVKNEKGEYKKDQDGNYINNPLYDPTIDPHTGTKKQLVWFDLNAYNGVKSIFTKDVLDNFGNLSWENPDAWKYYKETLLPAYAKTLFSPNYGKTNDKWGFIAEAIVLGKGGLKEIIGEADTFLAFPLKKVKDPKTGKYLLKYEFDKEPVVHYQELKTTETDYFSTSGIWLFHSKSKEGITNFKLVLIQEPGASTNDINNPPNSYFTDNVVLDSGQIEPLWKTKRGIAFYNYLTSVGISEAEILKMNYEDVMEHYKQYIEKLYYKYTFNTYITIDPIIKPIPDDKYTVDEFLEKFKDPKVAETELLGEFNNKDKVNIEKVELAQDNSGVNITFKLNSYEDIYQLRQNKVFLKVKFKDIKQVDKKIINLKLNRQYFIDTAANNFIDDFVNAIYKNKEQWFNDLNEQDLQALSFSVEFNSFIKLLTIKVDLKNSIDNNVIIVPNKTFSIPLITFKTNGIEEFEKPNKGAEKPKPSTHKNIFENVEFKTIELNGLDNIEEIKKFIISDISKQLKNLKYNEDYEIRNLNSVAQELSVPQIKPTNPNHIHNALLNIVAKKASGVKYAKVNNVVDNIFVKNIDLKEIKIPDHNFVGSKVEHLKSIIENYAQGELKKHNLILNKDVKIANLDNAIRNLAKGKGYKHTIIIKPINRKITGLTSYQATNNAKEVRDKDNNLYLIDLSALETTTLSYKENILSNLRQYIINDINKYLNDKYELKYGVDYTVDINKLNEILKSLPIIKDEKRLFFVRINPVNNVSKNFNEFKVENTFTKQVINDLDEVSVQTPKDKQKAEELKARNKKILIGVLAPLAIITIAIGITVAWWIKVRHFDKKIK